MVDLASLRLVVHYKLLNGETKSTVSWFYLPLLIINNRTRIS